MNLNAKAAVIATLLAAPVSAQETWSLGQFQDWHVSLSQGESAEMVCVLASTSPNGVLTIMSDERDHWTIYITTDNADLDRTETLLKVDLNIGFYGTSGNSLVELLGAEGYENADNITFFSFYAGPPTESRTSFIDDFIRYEYVELLDPQMNTVVDWNLTGSRQAMNAFLDCSLKILETI